MLLIAVGIVFTLTGCQTIIASGWQRSIQRQLSGLAVTEHFDVRYRPSSRSALHARRVGSAAELELSRICARLEVANDVRYTLFLFDNVSEVGKVAHNDAIGGFSAGRFVCVTVDDDGARFHELIHAVAGAKIGDAKKSFLVEGLAGALFEPSQGMDPHAGAKSYREQGKLPPLSEVSRASRTKAWIAWIQQHSEINGYTVAGSWMQFLLETYGAEKTKHYYLGQDATAVFGVSTVQLERAWWTALDHYVVPPTIKARLEFTHGKDPERHTAVVGESFGFECGPVSTSLPADKSLVFIYAWRKNGEVLHDMNSGALSMKSLSVADSGIYSISVTAKFPDGGEMPVFDFSIALTVLPRPDDFSEKTTR